MIVANVVDGRAIIVDRIKEMVRLAGGPFLMKTHD